MCSDNAVMIQLTDKWKQKGETTEKVEVIDMSQKPAKQTIKHVHPRW